MAYDGDDLKGGAISTLGVRKESTYGTRDGGGTTVKIGDEASATFHRANISPGVGGIRAKRQVRRYYEIGSYYDGEISDIDLLDVLPLYAALGKISTTGPIGAVYTHTVSPAGDDGTSAYLPSYTLEGQYVSTTPTSVELLGMVVRTLNLRVDIADPLVKATISYISKSLSTTISAPAEKTDIPYNIVHATLKIDDDAAVYSSGVEIKDIKSFNFSYDNALPDATSIMEWTTGLIRQPFPETLRDNITGTIIRRYVDDDVADLIGNTEFSMMLELVRTAGEDEIKIQMDHCLCGDLTRPMGRDTGLEDTDLTIKIGDVEIVSKDDKSAY